MGIDVERVREMDMAQTASVNMEIGGGARCQGEVKEKRRSKEEDGLRELRHGDWQRNRMDG